MPLFLSITLSLIADLFQIGGDPQVVVQDGPYEKIALTDSTTLEVYKGDSILVVFTAPPPTAETSTTPLCGSIPRPRHRRCSMS